MKNSTSSTMTLNTEWAETQRVMTDAYTPTKLHSVFLDRFSTDHDVANP
jgi:hypothetical protein